VPRRPTWKARVDGHEIGRAVDPEPGIGMAGLGSGLHGAQFDNLTIRPVPGYESEELSTLRNKLFANLAPDQSLLASAATSLKRPFMAGAERLP
jgi:hypothetical protein